MSATLNQVKKQLAELQKIVDAMSEIKMEVSRQFTGQYIKPYNGKQYRRMESEGVSIWECFSETDGWVTLENPKELEEVYTRDCTLPPV